MKIQQRFNAVMRRSSVSEVQLLLKMTESKIRLQEWHPRSKTITESKVQPWPAIFLLNSFHAKHVFVDRKLPPAAMMLHSTSQFIEKQRWRWYHRNNPREQLPRLKKFNITPPCRKDINSGVAKWLREAAHTVMHASEKARASWKFQPKAYTNTSELFKWGLQSLKHFNLFPVKRDKEPGFVVISKDSYRNLLDDTFQNSEQYMSAPPARIAWHTQRRMLERQINAVAKADKKWQEEHGKNERHGLRRVLSKPLDDPRAKVVGHVDYRCKSHKPDGAVGPRVLHATTFWLCSGIAAWTAEVAREYISKYCPWVVQDALAFKASCSKVVPDRGAKWIKADVKDFFYSGKDPQILAALASVIPEGDSRKKTFLAAVAYLLDNQLVRNPVKPDELYWSMQGSAMGLIHSGDLMDLCFFAKAEKFIRRSFHNFGIQKYWRYKDDLLFLMRIGAKRVPFCQQLICEADWFKIVVEKIGATVRFLEFEVSELSGRINLDYCMKETAHLQPLGTTSAHHKSTHWSWPLGMRSRVQVMSSSTHACMSAWAELHKRFMAAGHPMCELFKPKAVLPPACKRQPVPAKVWMVLPYHPAFAREIQAALARFNDRAKARTQCLFGRPVHIGIAWSVGAKNLLMILNRRRIGEGRRDTCV